MLTINERQRLFLSYATDVLIYIVVLNLFVEFSDAVVIDSFAISILTAILLKIMLDVILALEHRVSAYFEKRDSTRARVLRVLAVWFILFSSKFVILEVVDIVFGEHVELGKFLDVILLVVALMVAREVFQRMFRALGGSSASDPLAPAKFEAV